MFLIFLYLYTIILYTDWEAARDSVLMIRIALNLPWSI